MRRLGRCCVWLLLCWMLCIAAPALAGDLCTIDVFSVQGDVGTDRSFVQFTCPSVDGDVMVTVRDQADGLVYQKDYGPCSGTFRSDEIYLSLNGSETIYRVSVGTGADEYAFQLRRKMPRLTDNTACSFGCPLSLITGKDSWKSAMLLDLTAMEEPLTVPMQASGAYTLGDVCFDCEQGLLTVSAKITPGIDGTIDKAVVYVASNALEATKLDTKKFAGLEGRLDEPIDVTGLDYAAVYVKLTVSFDPSGVPGLMDLDLTDQLYLLDMMNNFTISEEVG